MAIKTLTILGVSGSIGKQTIEVVKKEKKWTLEGISVGNNIKFAKELIEEFPIKYVYTKEKSDYENLKDLYKNTSIKFFYGDEGLLDLIKSSDNDIYVNAIGGFAGVLPSIEVIKKEKILCLANKETIVCLGELFKELKSKYKNAVIIPIDSEHVGVEKCLNGVKNYKEVIITASGGPFFDIKRSEFINAKASEALKHPSWNMGRKITIDSSTMINKAFEIIEAYYLFDIPINKIKILVDRTSYVHAIVKKNNDEYRVNFGPKIPTMKVPISYALNLREFTAENDYIDVETTYFLEKFNLKRMNFKKFPLINFGKKVLRKKGNFGVAFNACSEIAVESFLQGKINYIDIEKIVVKIMNSFHFLKKPSLEEIVKTDKEVRSLTSELIERSYK